MSGGKCMKTCIVSFIAVFAFIFGYDFVVHGMLLKPDYEATAQLWRTEEEMQQLGMWCLIYHGLLAALFTCWFKKSNCNCAICNKGQCSTTGAAGTTCCPMKSGGLCFGIKIGLLMGILHASSYIWMPIPGNLAIKWFFTGLFQGVGVGVILGMIKGCMSKGSCEAK